MKLNREDQYRVYTYYVGEGFQLGTAYLSPLPLHVRGKRDRSSSFNIYETRSGNLRWKDFGGGGELRGDALDFIIVMQPEIYNLPRERQFKAAMAFFESQIKHNRLLTPKLILQQETRHSISKRNRTDPIPHYDKEFTNSELQYWCDRPLLIARERLEARRVYGFRGIDWGDGVKFPSTAEDPAFIYDLSEKGDMSSWKAYRPLTKNKRYKWKSWNLSDVPFEGYYLLPESGEYFMFTSSYKDGLVAERLGWVTGNPTGEGAYRSILPIQNNLNCRFDTIFILFDGDSAGISAAKNLAELTGWIPLFLDYPIKTGKRLWFAKKNNLSLYTKDLAEVVENYNYRFLARLINEAIEKHNIYDRINY